MPAVGLLAGIVGATLRRGPVPVAVVACVLVAGTTATPWTATVASVQARDERPWNRAYRDGLEQLRAARFPEAERSFRRALAADRAPAERTRPVVFDNIGDRAWFLPEYYLAKAILNQRGREAEAFGILQAVQKNRQVGPNAPEAGELPTLIARAEAALPKPAVVTTPPATTVAANTGAGTTGPGTTGPGTTGPGTTGPGMTGPPGTTGAATGTPPVSTGTTDKPVSTASASGATGNAATSNTGTPTSGTGSTPPVLPEKPTVVTGGTTTTPTSVKPTVDPLALLKQGRGALAARRYSDARAFARDAVAAGASAAASALMKEIDTAERLDLARAIDDRDRAGMTAFFAGNYQEAIRRLEDRIDGGLPGSARTFFYLACANAALAELPGEDAAERRLAGRRFYGRIGKLGDVQQDMRYISPKVREALER